MSGSLQFPVLLLIFYEQWLFVVGIIVFPQKTSWSSIPWYLWMWFYLEISFCRCKQVKMRSHWNRVVPNPAWLESLQKGDVWTKYPHRETPRVEQSDTVQQAEKRLQVRKEGWNISFSGTFRGTQPCRYLFLAHQVRSDDWEQWIPIV